MTDVQIIEQKAKEYADYFYQDRNSLFWNERYNSYIAGAHNRDEEIRQLYDVINDYSETIEKLRNPWISVEERLPEHKKPIIFKSGDKAFGGWYNEDMEEFQTKAPDGGNWAMHGVKLWYYQMPIPN